eukprot:TRINITY_DN14223_c0_g1_i1.p1 TRINITY_DN14223_c0_g1~~TRINITY_DN14223_c0_g1_i1.p1  ORF type:complete len:172 (+),score=44.82 TRINITY_DN14223_c0_g1_i1:60-575(+)
MEGAFAIASQTSHNEGAPKVVLGFGKALQQAAEKRDTSKAPPLPLSCFSWPGKPALDIEEYVLHLHRHCGFGQDIFVLALVYITRAVELNPGKVGVSKDTVHRLALAATLVAAKYHDDKVHSNEVYAKAGSVEAEELEMLEAGFCELFAWKLQVDDTMFSRIRQLLIASAC